MKNKLLLFFILLLGLVACNKEVDYATVTNTIRLGSWRIDNNTQAGADETERFIGYTFTFNMDSTVSVDNGSQTITGIYEVSNGNSNTQLNFYFNEAPLSDLNRDWHVVNLLTTRVEMENNTNPQSPVDYLYLQKN